MPLGAGPLLCPAAPEKKAAAAHSSVRLLEPHKVMLGFLSRLKGLRPLAGKRVGDVAGVAAAGVTSSGAPCRPGAFLQALRCCCCLGKARGALCRSTVTLRPSLLTAPGRCIPSARFLCFYVLIEKSGIPFHSKPAGIAVGRILSAALHETGSPPQFRGYVRGGIWC